MSRARASVMGGLLSAIPATEAEERFPFRMACLRIRAEMNARRELFADSVSDGDLSTVIAGIESALSNGLGCSAAISNWLWEAWKKLPNQNGKTWIFCDDLRGLKTFFERIRAGKGVDPELFPVVLMWMNLLAL